MPTRKPAAQHSTSSTPPRARRVRTTTPRNWRKVFLRELAIDGNRTRAAAAAGVDRQTVYNHRNSDPTFRVEWDAAIDQAAEYLEAEAMRRAVEGVEEPLTCAKGLIYDELGNPVMVRKYSDSLMQLLLKGARPEKYRENVKVSGSVEHSLIPRGEAKSLANELLAAVRDIPEARAALSRQLLASGE